MSRFSSRLTYPTWPLSAPLPTVTLAEVQHGRQSLLRRSLPYSPSK